MKKSFSYITLLFLLLFILGCSQTVSTDGDAQEDSMSRQETNDSVFIHIDTVFHTDTIFNISVKPIVHLDTNIRIDTNIHFTTDYTTRIDTARSDFIDTVHTIRDLYDTIISQSRDTLYIDTTIIDTVFKDIPKTDTIHIPFTDTDTIHITDSIPVPDTTVIRYPYYIDKDIDTTLIGAQIWMASNWDIATEESFCYGDSLENCEIYGRLYTWAAAGNACPADWHLPSKEEFETLLNTIGGKSQASEALKSTIRWKYGSNGLDEYDFWALPAGIRNRNGLYEGLTDMGGFTTCFWTSTEADSDKAYCLNLGSEQQDNKWVSTEANLVPIDKEAAVSLRCVKD